ncbi:MAG: hypothetical protein P8Z42_00810, partial [Anaerolineales bacterium]
ANTPLAQMVTAIYGGGMNVQLAIKPYLSGPGWGCSICPRNRQSFVSRRWRKTSLNCWQARRAAE